MGKCMESEVASSARLPTCMMRVELPSVCLDRFRACEVRRTEAPVQALPRVNARANLAIVELAEGMELPILGGTAFLGRAIAHVALDRGHAVTCVVRGNSSAPREASLISADRDGDGLASVATRSWAAVIDLSRQPGQIRRAGRDLSIRHWYPSVPATSTLPSPPSSRTRTHRFALH